MSGDRPAPSAPGSTPDPAPTGGGGEQAPWWRRGLGAFGRFWWDFLVGDTPELLVGSVLAVGAAALLVHSVGLRVVVVGALPVLVAGILALSVWRARSEARRHGDSETATDAP